MRSIIRNARILSNPAGTSLAEYTKRFNCFVYMDVLYGILFGVTCGLYIAGSSVLANSPEFSGGTGLLMAEALPALVCVLFLLDAVLGNVMNKNIQEWPGTCSSAQLHKIINVNIASNGATILVYIGWRLGRILNLISLLSDTGVGGGAAINSSVGLVIGFFLLISVSKVSKVLVIWSFHRWLQAQDNMGVSAGQQMPGTIPATAPLQGVVVAPPATGGYAQQHQAFQQSQA